MSGYYVQFNIVENSLTENKNAVQKIPAQKEYRNCMNGTAYSRSTSERDYLEPCTSKILRQIQGITNAKRLPIFPSPKCKDALGPLLYSSV
jgi:hypothetical protein